MPHNDGYCNKFRNHFGPLLLEEEYPHSGLGLKNVRTIYYSDATYIVLPCSNGSKTE